MKEREKSLLQDIHQYGEKMVKTPGSQKGSPAAAVIEERGGDGGGGRGVREGECERG